MGKEVILFGASNMGAAAYHLLKDSYSIIGFCDNDPCKYGKKLCNIDILAPSELTKFSNVEIIITSMHYLDISKQLIDMGIFNFQIFKYSLDNESSGKIFLKSSYNECIELSSQSKVSIKGDHIIVLGINGIDEIFHDASATLVVDNKIIASIEEERFNRKKHSNGIPFNSIKYCLDKAGIKFSDIDYIGYYLDPNVLKQNFYDDVIKRFNCNPELIQYYIDASDRIQNVEKQLKNVFGETFKTKFKFLNHHLAHASSSYYISGFNESSILTIDGSGDRETCTLYHGEGPNLSKVCDFLIYPESLGFIYTVISYHLGFDWISGPGKLMGLAGYGNPNIQLFEDVILLNNDPQHPISIDLSFFDYHIGGMGLSKKGLDKFGIRREANQPFEQKHYDLAASIQLMIEKAIIHLTRMIPKILPNVENLCLAGGVTLNVCTNRRINDLNIFKKVFITPPAYDGGTSLGCALYLNAIHNNFYKYDFNVYCGTHISEDYSIENALNKYQGKIIWEKMNEDQLCEKAAIDIKNNKIIGWAQGRMECGPRALGNRSILTNAMNPNAKNELNTRVKKREWFRPYASSVLKEESSKWFDLDESRYMLLEATVLSEKREIVPGIVHVDGTSRPQTVRYEDNPRYYKLIKRFFELTNVPMVLNTSFNLHGAPIVNTPEEAIDVLLNTEMDVLIIDDYYILKNL